MKMEICHVPAGRNGAASCGVNGQVVHIIDLERIAGKNADHWSNTLAVIGESIPAIGTEGRVKRKKSDATLRPDVGRRGDGDLAVSSDAAHRETKSGNTTPIPNTHSKTTFSLFPRTLLEQTMEARKMPFGAEDYATRRICRADWMANIFVKNGAVAAGALFEKDQALTSLMGDPNTVLIE